MGLWWQTHTTRIGGVIQDEAAVADSYDQNWGAIQDGAVDEPR